jgi:hypothetical protein
MDAYLFRVELEQEDDGRRSALRIASTARSLAKTYHPSPNASNLGGSNHIQPSFQYTLLTIEWPALSSHSKGFIGHNVHPSSRAKLLFIATQRYCGPTSWRSLFHTMS